MWNLRVGAYCLMPNHYHLLIQAPDANISRRMHHLSGKIGDVRDILTFTLQWIQSTLIQLFI